MEHLFTSLYRMAMLRVPAPMAKADEICPRSLVGRFFMRSVCPLTVSVIVQNLDSDRADFRHSFDKT